MPAADAAGAPLEAWFLQDFFVELVVNGIKLGDLELKRHPPVEGRFDLELSGRIDSKNGGIRNTFETVPDAPVTKFVLKMQGGKKSLLVNSRNLCKSSNRATVHMEGQNGKLHNDRPVVKNGCAKKKAKGKKGHAHKKG